MTTRIYILLIYILISWQHLSGQTLNPRYNFKHLNVQNGLAQNIVYHFLHDSHGYMWLGTRNGLTIYDGIKTTNFIHDKEIPGTIASNFITRILEDSSGQIWIGTDVGVSLYNRKEKTFSNFSVFAKDEKNDAFCVPLAFVNRYELWVIEAKSKSIKSFDTRTHNARVLTSSNAIDGMLWNDPVSKTRHIWTYLSTGTIHYVFKNNTLVKKENFFTGINENPREPVYQIVHVEPQNDSTVWLSSTAGLIELNPNNRKYNIYTNWGKQKVNQLRYAVLSLGEGLLWIATGNNGVYTFNLKTKKYVDNFRSYRLDPFSICSNNIVSLYFDRFGNIWCGSYGNGISYTNVEKNYFQKNLSRNELDKWEGNNNIHWIGKDNDGNYWCLMNDATGLWKLNSEKQIIEHREPLLDNGETFTGTIEKILFEDNRKAWCIGNAGLYQYDVVTNRIRKMQYPARSTELFGSYWIKDIISLNNGTFLFSTFKGVYQIAKNKNGYDIHSIPVLDNKSQPSYDLLYQDNKNNIYIKDVGEFLYVLRESEDNTFSIIKTHSFLPETYQYYTDTVRNKILLATNHGLFEIDQDSFNLKKSPTSVSIPFLSISSLIKTDKKLWLFGEKGLFCLDEKTNTARTFTIEDGLPANEFNTSALYFSPTGECVAGTTNGLVSFFPNQLHDTIFPPLAQLTNIYINDAPIGFVPNAQEIDKISLSHSQNTFSFDFAPIAFQNAGECTYEYQLQGYDEHWIRSGPSKYTRYSKIPPGTYVFQLHVIDANGRVSPHNKNLEIKIAKAFWQTNVFRVLLVLLLASGVWLITKRYLNRKIRKQKLQFEKQQAIAKERTRIATDMHDDLGAGLSRIKYLSESIQFKKQNDESITNEVVKIASYSDEMVEKMGEIVWALNEKNDTLADLIAFTRSYAVDYLSNHDIECIFHIPEELPQLFVTGETRRNIFLSVKESLHNVVKHAKAGIVTIRVTISNHLKIVIHDNGVGINLEHIRPFSNGLTNIQTRMHEVGGKAQFEKIKGTKVILIIPIPK